MQYRREKTQIEFQAGEIVFHEGDRGNKLFIITDGEVEITKKYEDEEVPLTTLKKGSIFGEMALVGRGFRTATVRAVTRVSCLSMSQVMFRHKLSTEVPDWMQTLFHALVDRLRVTTVRAVAESRPVPSYQIVELLAMFLKKGETTSSGAQYIPCMHAIKKIAYILDIKEKQVSLMMEILARSEIAGFETDSDGGRRFLVNSLEVFTQFADYCEETFLRERRKRDLCSETLTTRDQKILAMIVMALEGESGAQILGSDELFERIHKQLNLSSEAYADTVQRLVDEGVVEVQPADGETSKYKVNLDLCRQKIIAYEMRETFEKLKGQISLAASKKAPEETLTV